MSIKYGFYTKMHTCYRCSLRTFIYSLYIYMVVCIYICTCVCGIHMVKTVTRLIGLARYLKRKCIGFQQDSLCIGMKKRYKKSLTLALLKYLSYR